MESSSVFRELDYAGSRALLAPFRTQCASSGRLDELKIDGRLILDTDPLPEEGGRATFAFTTSMQDSARFFRDVADLAGYRPLGRGRFPERFYLVEEDYLHGQGETPPDSVRDLVALTQFVSALVELADHKYQTDGTSAWTLVFRTTDGLGLLETKFGPDLLGVRVPSLAWEVVKGLRTGSDGIHDSSSTVGKLNLFGINKLIGVENPCHYIPVRDAILHGSA